MKRLNARGATLIEAMAAAAVLAIGILGLLAAQVIAAKQNGMAARQTRASALAQDAAAAIKRWPYDDARIANVPGNDGAILEGGRIAAAPDPADFELDLNEAPGAYAPPVAADAIDYNDDGDPDFQRLVHVEPFMVDGAQNGLVVSVIVAYREELGWRQVVMRQSKYDPALNLATIPAL